MPAVIVPVSVAIFEPFADDDVDFVHGNQRHARATSPVLTHQIFLLQASV